MEQAMRRREGRSGASARGRCRARSWAWCGGIGGLTTVLALLGVPCRSVGGPPPAAPARGLYLGPGRTLPPMEMAGPMDSTIGVEVVDRLRGEFVDWFEPPSTSTTPTNTYNFIGNKFQLGLRVKRDPVEVFVQFQDSTLSNLPRDGVGVGATYYANTRQPLQNGAILRNAWMRATRLFGVPGLFVKAGRQLYLAGAEAPAANPGLAWVQNNRLAQRLIGPFDYTHVGRSFDGGQFGHDAESYNFTAFGFRPTYGGFEVDANRELDIDVAGAAVSLKDSKAVGNTIAQLAYYYYYDYRDVAFVDNRPASERNADKGSTAGIHTVGANAAHVLDVGPGFVDAVAYGYGQFGRWQSLHHQAWAYGAETGYRITQVWAKPWLRTGINSGSGDTNPDDQQHGTFFQMLPTAWLYAKFPFYNMMNSQDVFGQMILDPDPRLTFQLDFHWLRVNSSNDLSYSGGGATKNDFFGYAGLPTAGRNELAYLTHFLLTVRATQNVTLNMLYGHAWGQGIINQNYVDRPANYGYIETILAF